MSAVEIIGFQRPPLAMTARVVVASENLAGISIIADVTIKAGWEYERDYGCWGTPDVEVARTFVDVQGHYTTRCEPSVGLCKEIVKAVEAWADKQTLEQVMEGGVV